MRSATLQQVITPLRWLLYLGSAFAFVAGIQLVFMARHTDQYFAWTVKPVLNAAVLGAFFWGATLFGFLSARERTWANARIALPAAVVFTALTLATTLIHIDRFHLAEVSPFTHLLTYAWLAVYAIELPLFLLLLYLQARAPGGDPPRSDPLPASFRLLLGIQSAVAILTGAALFIDPGALIPLWGWDLNPLTARALGAWLVPLGMVGAQAIWENDWVRARAAMISYTVLGVLQLVVFGIFYDSLLWESPAALAWVAYCLLVLAIGGYGATEALRASRLGTNQHQAASPASSGSLR